MHVNKMYQSSNSECIEVVKLRELVGSSHRVQLQI